MGCCFSVRSRDEDSSSYAPNVAQEHHPTSSSTSAPADPSSRQQPHRPPSNEEDVHHSRVQRPGLPPLNEHYNQPVRPHIWRSKRRSWTPTQLAREREEFFDTRVTGRPEVWAALRAAVTLLRDADLETTQGIIDAAGVTVPTGDLCEGCYDENGVLYRLPQCIVSDPENMVDDTESGRNATLGEQDLGSDEGISDRKMMADESDEELIPEDLEARREDKGKMSERDMIPVRARLSDRGGPDVTVTIGKTQNVGVLARKVQNEAGVSSKQRVRIVYLGRMLKEHEPLLNQGWDQAHMVNALVVARSSSS